MKEMILDQTRNKKNKIRRLWIEPSSIKIAINRVALSMDDKTHLELKQLDKERERDPKFVYLVTKVSDRKEMIRTVIRFIKNTSFTSYINREM